MLCNDVLPAEYLHEVSLPVKGEIPRESKHTGTKALCASRGYYPIAAAERSFAVWVATLRRKQRGFSTLCDSAEQ